MDLDFKIINSINLLMFGYRNKLERSILLIPATIESSVGNTEQPVILLWLEIQMDFLVQIV